MSDFYNDKIDKGLQEINKATQDAINLAVKLAKPKQIFAVFEIVASIIASIGINLVAFSFDFSCFTDGWFYVSSLCTLAAIILIYRGTINAIYPKTASRPVVVEAKAKYYALNEKKGLDLEDYLKVYNRESKKDAWKAFIGRKILYWQKKKDKFRSNLTRQAKIEEKCNEHIKYLSQYVTDEYLEANIDRINIKYNKVYYSDFNMIEKGNTTVKKFRPEYDRAFNKATMNKVIYYIATTMLLGVGMFSQGEGDWVSWVSSTAVTLIMIVVRIATALQHADIIFDNEITRSYLDKTEVLEKYFQWQKTNKTQAEIDRAVNEVRIEEQIKAETMLKQERDKHAKELQNAKDSAIKVATQMLLDGSKNSDKAN